MSVLMEALVPILIDGRIIDTGDNFVCSVEYSESLIESSSAKTTEATEAAEPAEPAESKKLTKADLIKIAEENGLDLVGDEKKSEIENALLEAGVELNAEDV